MPPLRGGGSGSSQEWPGADGGGFAVTGTMTITV
jgi:hypothetical protein